jgi:magnesium chelatase family protein
MSGPPGTGKSMLAQRFPGLLPPMDEDEALEAAAVHRSTAASASNTVGPRPFQAPHHTASAASLVGGGSNPRPGEISLAHHGVLFLDELPEFERRVLEALREPLESGHDPRRPRRAARRLPGALPAGRGDEPLPLRPSGRTGALPLHAGPGGALSRRCPGRCSTAST